jgi:hypothetical protein
MLRIIPPHAQIQNIFLFSWQIKNKTENKTAQPQAHLLHQGALTGAAQTAKAPAGYRQHGALAIQARASRCRAPAWRATPCVADVTS